MDSRVHINNLKRRRFTNVSSLIAESFQDREFLRRCVMYFREIRSEFDDEFDEFDELLMPPFPPFLFRAVNISHPDYQMVNARNRHNTLTIMLNQEFLEKKNVYCVKIKKIQLVREIYLRGKYDMPLDILRHIALFL
jgi:hypothetical protein